MPNIQQLLDFRPTPTDINSRRFTLRKKAFLVSIRPSLSGLSRRICEIVELSRTEAKIRISTTIGLPSHYYLQVDGFSSRIGCAEIHRDEDHVVAAFLVRLDIEMLRDIVWSDQTPKVRRAINAGHTGSPTI